VSSDDTLGVRLRPEIVAVPAYRQGRPAPADGFKLSSNENPYPPLPGVLEAATATAATMNRYPDMRLSALYAAISERLFGTLGAEVALALKGAHIIRTHDVKSCVEALRLADVVAG